MFSPYCFAPHSGQNFAPLVSAPQCGQMVESLNPHSEQNLLFMTVFLQFGQTIVLLRFSIFAPHSRQNFAFIGIVAPQFEQILFV